MKLDKRIKRLIAVGASVSANCQPCLQNNAHKALEEGISLQEITEAVEVGRMVRHGAANSMDGFAAGLDQPVPLGAAAPGGGCECA